MDALISLVYTIIDSVCVCLFLDAFAYAPLEES